MPPLSAQEQDDEQGNNEAENGGAFCQGGAQQQVLADLAFSFRLILLSASGWRLMASAALPVAMPMPMPAPMPVSAAMPAPKATKLAIINYSFL